MHVFGNYISKFYFVQIFWHASDNSLNKNRFVTLYYYWPCVLLIFVLTMHTCIKLFCGYQSIVVILNLVESHRCLNIIMIHLMQWISISIKCTSLWFLALYMNIFMCIDRLSYSTSYIYGYIHVLVKYCIWNY